MIKLASSNTYILTLLFLFFFWAIFLWWREKKRRSDLILIGQNPSKLSYKWFFSPLFMALICFLLALMRPQWGKEKEVIRESKGVDLVLALDLSQSMMATDISPNRLERAKRKIADFLALLQGDRVGLVVFSGKAFIQLPLTLDYSAINLMLESASPDLISFPGTNMTAALEESLKVLASSPHLHSKGIILLTDGEDNEGGAISMAQKAKEQGVRIFTVGIGEAKGAPIPDLKTGSYKKDSQGTPILSKLDEKLLKDMAEITQGLYVRSSSGDVDLYQVAQFIKNSLKSVKNGDKQNIKQKEDQYQYFLGLGLVCLLFPLIRQKSIFGLFFFLFPMLVSAFSLTSEEKAHDFYKEKNYQEALERFSKSSTQLGNKNPKHQEELSYNLANSFYKNQQYEKALSLYEKMSTESHNPEIKYRSQFNKGNTLAHLGKTQEAIESFEQLLQQYPEDQEAKKNYELLKELLKKQEQKQQEQNKEEEQKKQEEEKEKKEPKKEEKEGKEEKQEKKEIAKETKKEEKNKEKKGDQFLQRIQENRELWKEHQKKQYKEKMKEEKRSFESRQKDW